MNAENLNRFQMCGAIVMVVFVVAMFGCGDGEKERLEARIAVLEEAWGQTQNDIMRIKKAERQFVAMGDHSKALQDATNNIKLIMDDVEKLRGEVTKIESLEREVLKLQASVEKIAKRLDSAPEAKPQSPSTSAPRTRTADAWADARRTIRHGDVSVRLLSARVGKFMVKSIGDQRESKDAELLIKLNITNRSTTRKLNYSTWAGADISLGRDYANLTDNHGNRYRRVGYGFGGDIVGQTKTASIYPGKSVTDLLIFEPPVDTAEYINLEMPGSNVGGEGTIRLRIPVSMITGRCF